MSLKRELYNYGPITCAIDIYTDFLYYYKGGKDISVLCQAKKNNSYIVVSGVYKYVSGDHVGAHAIKIIGWGEENGVPYWLGVNSWGKKWGDKGYFKVE